MGINGMSTFVQRNGLTDDYNLHDTTMVVDGSNLVHTLYYHCKNHLMFGGDYFLFTEQITNFFNSLKICNVSVIVIIDGSIDPSLEKLNTKLHRMNTQLNQAYKIYRNNCSNELVFPLYGNSVFCSQVNKLGIRLYRTMHEADDVITRIAKERNIPILSNDSDFFLENLPAGVIHLDSLLNNFRVLNHSDNAASYKYFKCSIYRIDKLKTILASFNRDLVSIVGPLLGNDYIDCETANVILSKLPLYNHKGNKRQRQIYATLKWISQFESIQDLLDGLKRLINVTDHPLISYIENQYLKSNTTSIISDNNYVSVDDYFSNNFERLFLEKSNIPVWLQKGFVNVEINLRLLTIICVHIDWCKPLVEDFSFDESSYQCAYNLNQSIYGLLRSSDKNIANVRRYCRRRTHFVVDKIKPNIYLDNDELLPKIDELEHLSVERRLSLFFRIIGLDQSLFQSLQDAFKLSIQNGFSVNENFCNKSALMLLALVYLLQNFPADIWLEFVYAIYVNIMLSGHQSSHNCPILLKVDSSQRKILNASLYRFNNIPEFTKVKIFIPRIVHFYNAYQNCLLSIEFLSEILNLKSTLNIQEFPFSLGGTFVYNMTVNLASRPKPLLYLEEIFGRQKFKPLELFRNLLNNILNNSNRTASFRGLDDKDIVPGLFNLDGDLNKLSINQSLCQDKSDKPQLVRGFEVTNRKTHIKSQLLKLRNKKN